MPMLPDRGRTRVLVVALAALGGAVILVAVPHRLGQHERWLRRQGRPPRRPHARRHRSRPVVVACPEGSTRTAGVEGRAEHSADLEEPGAGRGASAGQDVRLPTRGRDRRVRGHVDRGRPGGDGAEPSPIVFLHPSDPVRDGLVKSLSHPGTNLTGVYGARDEVDKQLEIYQLLVPELRRMLTLVDPTDKRTKRLLPGFQAAAAQLARPIQLDIREASSDQDLKRVFHSLKPGEVDGVFLLSPSLRLNHTALTIRLAKQARLPVQAHRKEWVEQGALFSYGIDLPLIGRTAARYVDSILKGTSPADLPVEEVPKLEFAINLKTAGRLGIKVPQNMIIRADEVYR